MSAESSKTKYNHVYWVGIDDPEYSPGYYWTDETDRYNGGPFETAEQAKAELDRYVKEML